MSSPRDEGKSPFARILSCSRTWSNSVAALRQRIILAVLLPAIVFSSVTMPVSANSLDPIYEVPTPTPGVETFHDGTFRILANNDEDVSPSYFDSDPGTDETYLGYPSSLDDEVMPSADALY